MIVVGSVIVLALFLVTGWAVATEMFQQRSWRRRVETGDPRIVAALIEEAMTNWRRARPPRGLPAALWAGVQGAQIVAVTEDSASLSASAEGEFRTEEGRRVQVSSALEEAMALAARIVDMLLYDVPNLRLDTVRVDIYSTFTAEGSVPVQRPILTTTAGRPQADALPWETMTPPEILGRFQTHYIRTASGQAAPIDLPPVEGEPPMPAEPSEITE
ncbi:MAG: hypothetical protein AB7T37_11855 [Dehalococcoidia bacterium]